MPKVQKPIPKTSNAKAGTKNAQKQVSHQPQTNSLSSVPTPSITAQELYENHRFQDALPMPPTIRPLQSNDCPCASLTITMVNKKVQLHSMLPYTEVWSYENSAVLDPKRLLGPTIEIQSGQPIQIKWTNLLKGNLPLSAVTVPYNDATDPQSVAVPQNHPGLNGIEPNNAISMIPPWTVVHLHGSLTAADSDGWAENAGFNGQSQTTQYANKMDSTMIWYHDHAMSITRLNVYAGLAGGYIIRDSEERKLKLPKGQYEIPLVIQDRNLDTDNNGNLTGKLIHKVESDTGPMEFFGPFMLVNGAIWPYANVKRRQYRLRFLNGSNARTYCFVLLDEQNVDVTSQAMTQIGTDGGLLSQVVPVPSDGLILAPGERADVIVDFSKLQGRIRLVNRAACPFGGTVLPIPPPPANAPDSDPLLQEYRKNRVPYPDVMEFRLANKTEIETVKWTAGKPLSTKPSHQPVTHAQLPHDHEHRLLALVEHSDGMLFLHELIEEQTANPFPAGTPVIEIQEKGATQPKRYFAAPGRLRDTINFFVEHGTTEVWKILNLTFDTHPFHIHLTQFQPLGRQLFDTTGIVRESDGSIGNTIETQPGKPVIYAQDRSLDDNEKGLKDVVRVNPGETDPNDDTKLVSGEMISLAVPFNGYTGRYMYHCHILEHEDMEMMRPFVVLPKAIKELMPDMGTHNHPQ